MDGKTDKAKRNVSARYKPMSAETIARYTKACELQPERVELLQAIVEAKVSFPLVAGLLGVSVSEVTSIFEGKPLPVIITPKYLVYATRCVDAAILLNLLPDESKNVQSRISAAKVFVDLSDKYEAAKALASKVH